MDLFSKLRKMKILLVDDDEWIRDSMSLFFEGEGCQLVALETAEEGMEEIKIHGYDVIIADFKLPGMDGLAFLERTQKSYPNALRILISAYGNEEVRNKAKKIGVQDFIEKPFSAQTIEESLSWLTDS
ncbi:MAG: response regulator [Deltaproteobacteria bacterium]|nr:response regulator [Deltaproteobacteria bacterium]